LKTSLIIPSYNPALKLPQTLNSLVGQGELIDELIVVADKRNYSTEIKSMLEQYSTNFNLKVVIQEISGRGRSRNKGVEVCKGDLLIFLDDDMLAEKDLIEKHIQHHLKNPNTIVSGNGYRNPENVMDDFGKYLINVEKGWKRESPSIGEITLQKFNFTACNASITKKIFNQLNGFDTCFSDGEDFDFAVRAINTGIPIIYDNTLLAWHNDWPGIDIYIKRQNEYTEAKMEIQNIHPEYLTHFPNLKVIKGSTIKKTASAIMRATIGKWVISKNRIFEILPLPIKFLFYRITISSYSTINR